MKQVQNEWGIFLHTFVNHRCPEPCLSMAYEQPFWGQITKDVPPGFRYQNGALVSSLSAFEIQKIVFQTEGVNKRAVICVVKEGWCGVLSSVSAGRIQGQGWVIASPQPAECLLLIIDTKQEKGTKYGYTDDSDQKSHPHVSSLAYTITQGMSMLAKTDQAYTLWPLTLGLDRKRSVFHQNNKCGQGDMTFKQQRQETHTHAFLILSTSEIKRPELMSYLVWMQVMEREVIKEWLLYSSRYSRCGCLALAARYDNYSIMFCISS